MLNIKRTTNFANIVDKEDVRPLATLRRHEWMNLIVQSPMADGQPRTAFAMQIKIIDHCRDKCLPDDLAPFDTIVRQSRQIVEFEQNISFYDEESATPQGEHAGGSHASPRPHWRKGYFRMQPHGPKMSLRRMRFIKPVMVMKNALVGNASETAAIYVGK